MNPRPPAVLRRATRRFSATAPALALLPQLLPRVDGAVLRLTRGRATATSFLADVPVVFLTATGAKSGQLRTSPLLAIERADRPGQLAVVASNFGRSRNPSWYYNLQAHPAATCRLRGQTFACTAHEADAVEYAEWWQAAVAVLPTFAAYKERAAGRHIPVMVLRLRPSQPADQPANLAP